MMSQTPEPESYTLDDSGLAGYVPRTVDGVPCLPDEAMRIRVGCKINLYLRILGRRENGYHDLDTFFMPLPVPYDILSIRSGKQTGDRAKSGLSVSCACPGIDLEKNTLTRAWQLYAEETGFAPRLDLHLEKGIPHGAGLGGGSADAASLLAFLQAHNPEPCTREKIFEIAKKTGADVPFFLYNSSCQAEGIGELLQPCPLPPFLAAGMYILVFTPRLKISTAWAFSRWDEKHVEEKNKKSAKSCLTKMSTRVYKPFSCLRLLENDFEPLVFEMWPGLRKCKTLLLQNGARAVLLSGSGSSMFALFRSQKDAEASMRKMQELGSVFLCQI